MMPAKDSYGDWLMSGEIDIMEFVGFELTASIPLCMTSYNQARHQK